MTFSDAHFQDLQDSPVNAVTTRLTFLLIDLKQLKFPSLYRFVKTATNKMRCPIFCLSWTPEGRRLITGWEVSKNHLLVFSSFCKFHLLILKVQVLAAVSSPCGTASHSILKPSFKLTTVRYLFSTHASRSCLMCTWCRCGRCSGPTTTFGW